MCPVLQALSQSLGNMKKGSPAAASVTLPNYSVPGYLEFCRSDYSLILNVTPFFLGYLTCSPSAKNSEQMSATQNYFIICQIIFGRFFFLFHAGKYVGED